MRRTAMSDTEGESLAPFQVGCLTVPASPPCPEVDDRRELCFCARPLVQRKATSVFVRGDGDNERLAGCRPSATPVRLVSAPRSVARGPRRTGAAPREL